MFEYARIAHATKGQLIYYVQAVDHPRQAAFADRPDVYAQALEVANMSSGTKGLMGVFSSFMGMRMKLSKAIMAPLLVQECPGEVVGVAFHEAERFGGHGPAVGAPPAPPPIHRCWERGWVLLDRLPLYVEFRVDEATEDYTGLGRPGVWFLEPTTEEWTLYYKLRCTVNHPRASRAPKPSSFEVQMTRCQIPGAPEPVGTYQNMQGKTARGPAPQKEPRGHTIDLQKPEYMSPSEYAQHLYMILGRATSLDYCLFVNFPHDDEGVPDWHWFEDGPPDYVVHFLRELERRARASRAVIERTRPAMKIFPLWARAPCARKADPEGKEFVYDAAAWNAGVGVQRRMTGQLCEWPWKPVDV